MPSEQALALQVQLFLGDGLHPDSKFGSIHGGYLISSGAVVINLSGAVPAETPMPPGS